MRRFGASWGAPICSAVEQAPTPTGFCCQYCGKPVAEYDQGLLIPDEDGDERPWHLHCFRRSMLGPSPSPV